MQPFTKEQFKELKDTYIPFQVWYKKLCDDLQDFCKSCAKRNNLHFYDIWVVYNIDIKKCYKYYLENDIFVSALTYSFIKFAIMQEGDDRFTLEWDDFYTFKEKIEKIYMNIKKPQ